MMTGRGIAAHPLEAHKTQLISCDTVNTWLLLKQNKDQ